MRLRLLSKEVRGIMEYEANRTIYNVGSLGLQPVLWFCWYLLKAYWRRRKVRR